MTPPRVVSAAILLALLGAACGETTESPDELVLLTHDSFAISESVLEAFEADTGVAVRILKGGDAGAMLSQAILTKDNPLADVMFGIDNTFLSRAVAEGIFQPYRSEGLDSVFELLRRSPDEVTPIDFGDVCINYDIEGLASAGISPPDELTDLADPRYAGLLVVEDASTSSPGLAFLLATIGAFPDGAAYDWRQFWTDLVANDVLIAPGWETAYYGEFSGGSGEGTRPLVVSYASSPPAEVYLGDLTTAPTGVLTDGCFRQIEYAGVLTGAAAPEAARQFIDYMLSTPFQEDIPLNMFVFPANESVPLPAVFVEHTSLPETPIVMEPGTIDANREEWIQEWLQIVRG